MFSANLKQFILTAHTQSLPICVPVPDYKVEVRRLDAVEDLTFPGTMSRTRITTDRLKVVLLHAMQNLVARTRVPEGVENFCRQMHLPALLPSKGCCVLHMLLFALPTVHRLLLLLLLLVELPCPQSHPRSPEPEAPQYPPRPPPAQYPPPPLMIPLPSTLVIVTRILIVMQTTLPPLKP